MKDKINISCIKPHVMLNCLARFKLEYNKIVVYNHSNQLKVIINDIERAKKALKQYVFEIRGEEFISSDYFLFQLKNKYKISISNNCLQKFCEIKNYRFIEEGYLLLPKRYYENQFLSEFLNYYKEITHNDNIQEIKLKPLPKKEIVQYCDELSKYPTSNDMPKELREKIYKNINLKENYWS